LEEETRHTKRERRRLGLLAHEPQDQRFSHAEAQAWFLEAAANEEPAMLRNLADEPLRVYRAVMWFRLEPAMELYPREAVSFVDRWATWEDFLTEIRTLSEFQTLSGIPTSSGDLAAALRRVQEALERWAAQWNLENVDWFKAAGLRTLAEWATLASDRRGWRSQQTSLVEAIQPEDRMFELRLEGWNPTWETRDHAVRRIREAFDQRLDTYLAAMDQRIDERGLVATPTKRGADEHWAWLAQRVVLGWTFDHIADQASDQRGEALSTESVHEAVKRAARLADLPLPPGKPGRRPKADRDRNR
jgi:hypothetical protein